MKHRDWVTAQLSCQRKLASRKFKGKRFSESRILNPESLIIFFFVLWAGCSPLPPQNGPMDEIKVALQGEKRPLSREPSAEVKETLLPSLELAAPSEVFDTEPRFDVVVDQVPAREFFVGLVQGTPYNLIVHPSVTGQISLRLTQVTIPEVLEAVHDLYGYEFERTRYGFKILPLGLRTEVFQINYLNVNRTGDSETRVSAGQVTNAGLSGTGTTGTGISSTTSTTGSAGVSQGAAGVAAIGLLAPGARVHTKSEADFWKELKETLKLIVGDKEGRAVVANPQTGVILVRAMPDELRSVREYLDKTELNIQRQVIIEAKILEVELKDEYRAGIDWTLIAKKSLTRKITVRQGVKGALAPNQLPVEGIGKELGGIFSAAFDFTAFDALIELLETQGNVQVLSSPQVSTVNNQKAVIRVGNDNFFITNISFQREAATAATAGQTTENIDITPFFSGIALDVIPQISENGYIILHVHPSVSEVKDEEKTVKLKDQTVTLPLAASTIRESDSIVRAKSGRIVVIGGLIQNLRKEKIAALPYLGKIPYMGSLFRQTQQNAVKSELVILLRPVLVEEDTFDEVLSQKQKRFDRVNRGFHYGSKAKIFGSVGEFQP